MEKSAFALVIGACKLKPYFQAHMVIILTNRPLRKAMSNPEVIEWMALWLIELSEFDIQYHPRMAFKGQVIADFIAEFTDMEGQRAKECPRWSIHMDELSNKQAGEGGVVLNNPEGDKVKCMVWLDFSTTNN